MGAGIEKIINFNAVRFFFWYLVHFVTGALPIVKSIKLTKIS